MDPYGSVGARIKTGRSPVAQDHFKTPPDPKKGYGMTKNPQKHRRLGGESKPGNLNGSCERDAEAGVLEFD